MFVKIREDIEFLNGDFKNTQNLGTANICNTVLQKLLFVKKMNKCHNYLYNYPYKIVLPYTQL